MISRKLRYLYLTSIILFIAHGLEEYFTGFYNIDPIFNFFIGQFSNSEAFIFLVFEVLVWILLIISFVLVVRDFWAFGFATALGLLFILELSHVVEVIISGGYYPGSITAVLLYAAGFLFWKELLGNYKKL